MAFGFLKGRSSDDDEPSDLLEDLTRSESRYIRSDRIALGGTGEIYEGFDRALGRPSVLKVLRPELRDREDLLHKFIREARITARLEHPNIIPIHDLGRCEDGVVFLAMKPIEGETLGSLLRRLQEGDAAAGTAYPLRRRLEIFRSVCDAAAFAHSRRVVHRDIKPGNVMIGEHGEVTLMDWGNALLLDECLQQPPEETVWGSPSYMSPEQANNGPTDTRTDVFQLGATLYHIATLRPPYFGRGAEEVLMQARIGKPIPASARAPEANLPTALCRIIARAMAHDPDDRYQSVDAMHRDLDTFLTGRHEVTTRRLKAGEYLMRSGDDAQEGYVILRGEVAIVRNKEGEDPVLLNTLGPGSVVGEMAMLTGEKRSASVLCLEDTEVEIVTREEIESQLERLTPWMSHVVQSLAERLRVTNSLVTP